MEPTTRGQITVDAAPETVYRLISDPASPATVNIADTLQRLKEKAEA